MLFLAIIWIGDSSAYHVGKAWGKRKFAPILSPNKTWEGALGCAVGSLIGAFFFKVLLLPELSFKHLFFLTVFTSAVGQLGDLAESMIKRSVRIKDSSNLIPGHGGILDKADSLFFAAPVFYYYLKLFAGI